MLQVYLSSSEWLRVDVTQLCRRSLYDFRVSSSSWSSLQQTASQQSIFMRTGLAYIFWNAMTSYTVHSPTVATFKRRLGTFDLSNMVIWNFGPTESSAIRSADFENYPGTSLKWIGWPVAEIWPFEIFQNPRSVGRWSVGHRSLVGRRSSIYTLFSCTPLRYVRNVAREE